MVAAKIRQKDCMQKMNVHANVKCTLHASFNSIIAARSTVATDVTAHYASARVRGNASKNECASASLRHTVEHVSEHFPMTRAKFP